MHLLHIKPQALAKVTFAARGFPATPSDATQRLEAIPQAVICGFEWGIDARDQWEVESRLNASLAAGRDVRVLFMPRGEALADPDLIRTKVNLIPEAVDPIRVIDIDGIDRQADGGTHVNSTNEIGDVRVMKTESKGKAFKRMRIAIL